MMTTVKIGKRGTIVIPTAIRRRLGLEEGAVALLEETADGVKIRAATAVPVASYTSDDKARFILETAVDADDYERAVGEVRRLGLDPARVPHKKP